MSEVKKVHLAIHAILEHFAGNGIPKDSKNQQQGYTFRGIEAVQEHLAPLLAKHKLLIIPSDKSHQVSECPSKGGGTIFKTLITVEYTFMSVEDGSTHVVESFGESMDSGDKATNKAKSVAYKTMAFHVFCIPVNAPDADNQTYEIADRHKPQPAKPTGQRAAPRPAGSPAKVVGRCHACGNEDAVILSQYEKDTLVCYKGKGGCGTKWVPNMPDAPEGEQEDPHMQDELDRMFKESVQ